MYKIIKTVIFLFLSLGIAISHELKQVDIYVDNTSESYYRAGEDFIKNYGDDYRSMYDKLQLDHNNLLSYRDFIELAVKISGVSENEVFEFLFERYPENQKQMILGMASQLKKDPRFNDILVNVNSRSLVIYLENSLLNSFASSEINEDDSVGFGCSMLANLNQDGSLILGRNFDWRTSSSYEQSSELVLTVYHNKDNGVVLKSIGALGKLGVVTAVTNNGTFFELNSGLSSVGPDIRLNRKDYGSEVLNLLLNSSGYSEIKNKIKGINSDYPYIVTIAGETSDNKYDVTVIEVSTHDFVIKDVSDKISYSFDNENDYRKLFSSAIKENYPYDINVNNLVITTNNFRSSLWRSIENYLSDIWPKLFKYREIKGQPLDSKTYSEARYNNLTKLALDYRDDKGSIDIVNMKKILEAPLVDKNTAHGVVDTKESDYYGATENISDGFVNNIDNENVDETTIYSVIFDSKSKTLSYRIQNQEGNDSWSKWYKTSI